MVDMSTILFWREVLERRSYAVYPSTATETKFNGLTMNEWDRLRAWYGRTVGEPLDGMDGFLEMHDRWQEHYSPPLQVWGWAA